MKRPSFSEELKRELAILPFGSNEESKAELFGFVKARGDLNVREGAVVFSLSSLAASRRLFLLAKNLGISILEITVEESHNIRKRSVRVKTNFPDEIFSVDPFEDVAVFSAFLRGLFLASGSMADPRYHYHLEINAFDEVVLKKTRVVLKRFFDINAGVVENSGVVKLYVKSVRDIIAFLEAIGSHEKVGELEKLYEERKLKSDVNRVLNFINANANRTGESNVKQIRAIKLIQEKIGLDKLPDELRMVALSRLENEELTLKELGEKLGMSKNQVYARLRKIMKLAERFGEER